MSDVAGSTPAEAAALVIEVPEAEPVVGEWRAAHDPVSRSGMPAHVTVLYPFRPPASIDPATLGEALDTIGDHAPFPVAFRSVATFPGGVVYLAPDPPDPFVRLTDSLVATFPDCVPYDGKFAETIPHLTVAIGLAEADRDALVADVTAALEVTPVSSVVAAVSLFTRQPPGGWVRRASIPLGTAPAVSGG